MYKYTVVEDDVGRCASDMDFIASQDDRGDDYISRKDYPASSSEEDSADAKAEAPSPDSAPAPDRMARAKEEPTDSKATGSSEAAPMTVDHAEASVQSGKRLRQTQVKIPSLRRSPQTPAEGMPEAPRPREEDRPVKMRVVLCEIHFLYGWSVKYLYDLHGDLKVREIESIV